MSAHLINRIGTIDGVCRACGHQCLSVFAGAQEDYPHGAMVECNECGERRKAKLNEIRSAMVNDREIDPDPVVTERERIHSEFVTWIESLPNPAVLHRDSLLDQVNRICSPDYG